MLLKVTLNNQPQPLNSQKIDDSEKGEAAEKAVVVNQDVELPTAGGDRHSDNQGIQNYNVILT